MTSKKKQNLLGILLLVFCVVAGIWGIVRQKKLKNNHVIGTARVYNYSSGGRGNAGGVWIDYVISVNGKNFKGSTRYLSNEISSGELNYFLGKTFPVVYNPSNPSISSLMLLPKDFSNRGYVFPDSLRWILPYLNNVK